MTADQLIFRVAVSVCLIAVSCFWIGFLVGSYR